MLKHLFLILITACVYNTTMAQQTAPHVDEVLQKAYDKAKAEKKNVFIIFHASWCGWCKKLDAAMNDPICKDFFDRNYVIEHITIQEPPNKKNLENPGGEAFYKKYAPENSGIPFWLIFSAEGQLIGDAKMPNGNNTGCPAAKEEVAHFMNVIKKSSKIDDKMSKVIYDHFRKNDPANK